MIFAAVFFMFVNTGPTNAILANVVHPVMRPAGFAVNILVIHVLGDVISPPIIGAVSGCWNMSVGFAVVSAFLALGGLLWLWGGRYLDRDTENAPAAGVEWPSSRSLLPASGPVEHYLYPLQFAGSASARFLVS